MKICLIATEDCFIGKVQRDVNKLLDECEFR